MNEIQDDIKALIFKIDKYILAYTIGNPLSAKRRSYRLTKSCIDK